MISAKTMRGIAKQAKGRGAKVVVIDSYSELGRRIMRENIRDEKLAEKHNKNKLPTRGEARSQWLRGEITLTALKPAHMSTPMFKRVMSRLRGVLRREMAIIQRSDARMTVSIGTRFQRGLE